MLICVDMYNIGVCTRGMWGMGVLMCVDMYMGVCTRGMWGMGVLMCVDMYMGVCTRGKWGMGVLICVGGAWFSPRHFPCLVKWRAPTST